MTMTISLSLSLSLSLSFDHDHNLFIMERNNSTVEEVGMGMVSRQPSENRERRGDGLDHLSC